MIQDCCLRRRCDAGGVQRQRCHEWTGRLCAATMLGWLLLVGCQHTTASDEPAHTSAAAPGRLTGFASIPFGASLDEVDDATMQRPGVRVLEERRGDQAEWIRYGDPHYRGYPARYTLCTAEHGFYFADIYFNSFTASGEEVLDQFVAVAEDLGRQYGPPHSGRGVLDPGHVADPESEVSLQWYFPVDGDPQARSIHLDVRHLAKQGGRRVPCLHLYMLDNTRLPGELAASRSEEKARNPSQASEDEAEAPTHDPATATDAEDADGAAHQATEPATVPPEQPIMEKLAGFLGAPFGSRAKYTKRVLLARPGVVYLGVEDRIADVSELALERYLEPHFAGQPAFYELHYFQDRLIMANVFLINHPGTAVHAHNQFQHLFVRLEERYGPPDTRRGVDAPEVAEQEQAPAPEAVWEFASPQGYDHGRRVRLMLVPGVEASESNQPQDPTVKLTYGDMHLRNLAADAISGEQRAE